MPEEFTPTSTNLAGTNQFEVVVFKLSHQEHAELFAINVYKVRELFIYRKPVRTPGAGESPVKGVLKVRDEVVVVFSLADALKCDVVPPELVVLCEFGGQTVAFPVAAVVGIEKCDWDRVIPAEHLLGAAALGKVSGLAKLEDGRLLTILDIESIVGAHLRTDVPTTELPKLKAKHSVLFADDSVFARKVVGSMLEAVGASAIETHDGRQAWDRLDAMAQAHSLPDAVITDIEMPNMDGYTLTRKIKADPRFAKVKVLMYSSLSAEANATMGRDCGADAYCAKFKNSQMAEELVRLLA